jgi:8-oxo-dGTP diphosphatase
VSGGDQVANIDVFLLLRDETGRLLFGLRASQLYAGGHWNLVSGKADAGEDVLTAVLREAREEAGITLEQGDLTPAAVVHYFNAGGRPRVGFGFHVRYYPDRHGPVRNAEPHKCDDLGWYSPATAPQPLEPYTAAILATATRAVPIGAEGWPHHRGAPSAHRR